MHARSEWSIALNTIKTVALLTILSILAACAPQPSVVPTEAPSPTPLSTLVPENGWSAEAITQLLALLSCDEVDLSTRVVLPNDATPIQLWTVMRNPITGEVEQLSSVDGYLSRGDHGTVDVSYFENMILAYRGVNIGFGGVTAQPGPMKYCPNTQAGDWRTHYMGSPTQYEPGNVMRININR